MFGLCFGMSKRDEMDLDRHKFTNELHGKECIRQCLTGIMCLRKGEFRVL